MGKRPSVKIAMVTTVAAIVLSLPASALALSTGRISHATSSSTPTWSNATELPGSGALNVGGSSGTISAIACPSAGNCTVVGDYTDATGRQAMVATETNGVWSNAIELPGSGTLNSGGFANLNAISCPSAGKCTVAGSYTYTDANDHAMIATETNGVWSKAIELPGSGTLNSGGDANLDALSCPSAGNCTVAGSYRDTSGAQQAMVATETNGVWAKAIELPGSGTLNVGVPGPDNRASLSALYCPTAGNCTVAGSYEDVNSAQQAMVATETNGVWSNAIELPGSGTLNVGANVNNGGAQLNAISCPSAGNCTVTGSYTDTGSDQAMVATETNGVWSNAIELTGNGTSNSFENANLNALSCPSAGNCTVAGSYADFNSGYQAMVATETNGVWSKAIELPGSGTLNRGGYASLSDLSCPTAGDCTVAGNYTDAHNDSQAMIATETNGVWSKAIELPGSGALNVGATGPNPDYGANLNAMSCSSQEKCTVAGSYRDANGTHQAMVATETNGVWSNAIELPGSGALNSDGDASLNALSCLSAGNCTVAGSYQNAHGIGQAMVATETNGVWSNAIELPGSGTLNSGFANLNTLSCPSAGNCTVAGNYTDAHNDSQAMVATETNGVWSKAIELPGSGVLNRGGRDSNGANLNALSCPSAGNCTVAGFYADAHNDSQAMVATETNGVWSKAIELPGSGVLNRGGYASLSDLSCPTAGNCTVAGYYADANGADQAMVATETNGLWSKAIELPGSGTSNSGGGKSYGAKLNALSCPTAGNCTVAGFYADATGQQAMVATETNGVWSKAIELPGSSVLNRGGGDSNGAGLNALSCPTAGNCTVAGDYADANVNEQAMVATETNGVWSNAIELPGSGTLNSGRYANLNALSCPTAGNCTVAGQYQDANAGYQAMVATETNGVWSKAIELPGSGTLNSGAGPTNDGHSVGASLNAVSCTSAGNCTVAGYYRNANVGTQAMVATETTGSPVS